jgi:transposase
MIGKLGPVKGIRACDEAGPTGYVLYWQSTTLGVDCQVVAPTLLPGKTGDRMKTYRRDDEKLTRCHRASDLTAVWVPDQQTRHSANWSEPQVSATDREYLARARCNSGERNTKRT